LLKRGLGYLALDPEDTAVSLVRVLAEAHTPFLWITSRPVSSPPDGGDLLRVTTLSGAMGSADPRRLQDLRTAATMYREMAMRLCPEQTEAELKELG